MTTQERKIFCYMPWKGLNISNFGLKPCCMYKGDIKANSIEEYENSEELAKLKQDMLSGARNEHCVRCWKNVDSGTHVKPDSDFHILFDNTEPDLSQEYVNISLMLSNICNLQCNYCGPFPSSAFRKEYETIYQEHMVDNKTWNKIYFDLNSDKKIELPKTYMAYDTFAEQTILDHAKTLKIIDIAGGEPFYTNQHKHYQFLSKLLSLNPDIRINYVTNGTNLPVPKVLELLLQFKQVCFTISFDAIGKKLEFIRYPIVWDDFYKNLQFYFELASVHSSVDLSVSNTVSVYSIASYNEFYSYAKQHNFPNIFNNTVHKPPIMNVNVLPQDIRQKLIDSFDRSVVPETIINTLNTNLPFDEHLYKHFISVTKTIESHRGLLLKDHLPELYELIKTDYEK